MSDKREIKSQFLKSLLAKGSVSNDLKNHSEDPFFIKKAQEAKKMIDRIGFPEELILKK